MFRLTMKFAGIECLRCGVTRQAGVQCADCKMQPAPTEVDSLVQMRQKAVAAASEARTAAGTSLTASPVDVVKDGRLGTFPARLEHAAQLLLDGRDPEARALQEVAGEVAALERWAADVQRRRPLVSFTDATCVVVQATVDLYDAVVVALTARDIAAAQRHEREVQAAFDRAGAAAQQVASIVEALARVTLSDDALGAWFSEATGGDPLTAASRGRDVFFARTGLRCGDMTGILALILNEFVSVAGDAEEFWRLVSSHLDLLDQRKEALWNVLDDPLYELRAKEVVHDHWSAARRATIYDPETFREAATDVLEAGHLALEQSVKLHLGVACAITTKMTFDATQASDVSQLANVARDKRWPIADAITNDVRNAFAHRDYAVTEDAVLLSPRRRSASGLPEARASLEDVTDLVLRLVEAGSAMELAVSAVSEADGRFKAILPPAAFLARSLLVGLGWEDVVVEPGDDEIRVSATLPGEARLSYLAFAAQPFAGTGLPLHLELERADTGATATLVMPLADYEQWSSSQPPEQEAAFVILCRRTMRDGRPVMSTEHASNYLAVRALQALESSDLSTGEKKRELATWRQAARALALDELVKAIGRAQRWLAYLDTGIPVDGEELRPLLAFVRPNLPPLRESLL